ncbi:hypothetical protein CHU_3459 [Sporocytophaga myxococcoides]|uniref:Chromosome segregation protein SMC n=1 Tax=Sporocytophaga myxococcoides TaxID=153721 RepID=A0A098LCW3_9BACT|nr:hypothetical protein [Sporocytophaga myxococcoides]GAL84731.1 hypothetical protein CHU_3459 [Sporocytophaga myxococcoides]
MENTGNTGGQRPKKDSSKTILVLVIVALIGVICTLIYSNMQLSDELEIRSQQMEADSTSHSLKTQELDELALAYERIRMEREELGLTKDSLDKKIDSLNLFIAEVRKGNGKAISHMKQMITRLKSELAKEDNQITALKRERDSLKVNVKTLTKRTRQMIDSLNYLHVTREELEEKVAQASILKAENIKVTAINAKGKEFEKDQYKAKNVDKLKITFVLADNIVARKDKKNLTMRLIEPSGVVLFDLSSGGGFFKAEGKELAFTENQTIHFDNTKQTVTFYYMKGGSYKVGTYTIELYSDGHKIGEADLQIK